MDRNKLKKLKRTLRRHLKSLKNLSEDMIVRSLKTLEKYKYQMTVSRLNIMSSKLR